MSEVVEADSTQVDDVNTVRVGVGYSKDVVREGSPLLDEKVRDVFVFHSDGDEERNAGG